MASAGTGHIWHAAKVGSRERGLGPAPPPFCHPSLRRESYLPPQLSQLARHRDALSADRFRQHMNRMYHMALTLWIDESHVDSRSRRRCAATESLPRLRAL